MNLNTTLGELLAQAINPEPTIETTLEQTVEPNLADDYIGRQVIVRTTGAGVIYGRLSSVSGTQVRLEDARQLWSWVSDDRLALSDVATLGTPFKDGTKFSGPVVSCIVNDVHTILLCSDRAVAAIDAVKPWK